MNVSGYGYCVLQRHSMNNGQVFVMDLSFFTRFHTWNITENMKEYKIYCRLFNT